MYARHRNPLPRGRTVLKSGGEGGSNLYPDTTLFPETGLYPAEEVTTTPATYTIIDTPSVDQVNAATTAYLGGHIYYVDQTEASLLTAAGFTVTPDAPDTTPPRLSILGPAHDSTVSGTFNIRLDYDSSVTAIEVTLTHSGQTRVDSIILTWPVGTTSLQVNSSNYVDGTWRIRAVVYDTIGNSSIATVDVQFRNVVAPPTGAPVLPSLTTLPSSTLVP